MGTPTDNHGFYVPDSGETGWGTEVGGSFTDLDTAVVLKDTLASRPAAGTEGRWFLATDTLDLFYDNGATWDDVLADVGDADTLDGQEGAHYLAHANLTDVSSDQHHAKYTDAEAEAAINNDGDHGSTAQHDYYTDADAEAAINADADHGSTASHDYFSGDHADLTNVSSDDHHTKTQPSDIDSSNWNDYEIQVDGTDGAGVINFKTS